MVQQSVQTAQFFQANTLSHVAIPNIPGVAIGIVAGDRLMVVHGYVEPGATLPLHSHPHEQITYVLDGMAYLQIGNEGRDLYPGEGAIVPGGHTHGIVRVGPQGCTILEVNTPLREEYLPLMRQAVPQP